MPKPRYMVEELCDGHWCPIAHRRFTSYDAADLFVAFLGRARARIVRLRGR